MADPTQIGRWDPVFPLPNVAIHTHLLPDGTVLFWGRRDDPAASLNEHSCTPHVWDPVTGTSTPTPRPALADGTTVNLFCSGHAFLPDGRLLVAGGHLTDGHGVNQACTYDHVTRTWAALPPMNDGRWYPTVTTLADGRALVISGSVTDGSGPNRVPQIWDGTAWQPTVDFTGLPLYPRMHVAPDGRVLMSGSNPTTYLLDTAGAGAWTPIGARANGDRQYAPSVMYAPGRVIYIGGGNDAGTDLPTAATEVIDLTAAAPAWRPAASTGFRRRQHNATVLPDGTVLVTGGTSGPGFDDVSPGHPVHVAELWDPGTDRWTAMAAEDVDRCYHATALLLPDATVLSAGGGEYVIGTDPNPPGDTHRDAQVFHPPYLFRGPRPEIAAAPAAIVHGEAFTVAVQDPDIARVTLVRLGSVTHSFDQNQRFAPLAFTALGTTLTVTAPAGPADFPPGHALLFVLSGAGVPSVARIVQVTAPAPADGPVVAVRATDVPAADVRAAEVRATAPSAAPAGTRVTVGLTAQCPYGLSACWGGAYEALGTLDGVAAVDPFADARDSTAVVHLRDQGLPDLDRWPARLAASAGGGYAFRGIELTLTGTLRARAALLHLVAPGLPAPVRLRALRPGTELAWDLETRGPRAATPDERDAYRTLRRRWRADPDGFTVRVTGPALKGRGGWSLLVRVVEDGG
ncbi:glyoxal oxidase [Pseudonocardia sp.]|uniref:glyoxal oxidase n=1 Tax=Pseudonocardia sp. TaxID=60912 RepID=UPI00261C8181|nr:glyoxal oxidase [Pseudonocardia sp.]MCW2718595.1 putative galactose oxidase [Pseudonocardia sp.]